MFPRHSSFLFLVRRILELRRAAEPYSYLFYSFSYLPAALPAYRPFYLPPCLPHALLRPVLNILDSLFAVQRSLPLLYLYGWCRLYLANVSLI